MKFNNSKLIVAFIILIIVGAIIKSGIVTNTKETVLATVSKTERVTYGSGETTEHKYLVYTDKETFECTDELLVPFNDCGKYALIPIKSILEFVYKKSIL
jgi:hypothetical protein